MTSDPDTNLSWYESNAKQYFAATIGLNMTVLYVPFLNYMKPYASILDAGCGSGRDTLYFSKRGYKVTGFDYSPTLVKYATKLTGQEILNLSFQDLDFREQFNGIWACNALNHIPMDEMQDVLSRLSRSMKVNGVLYASFNYGQGEHNRDGRFLVDFDEEGFDELIEQHPELAVLRCWKTSGMEKDRWLNILVRKTKPTKMMTFLGLGQSPACQSCS